MHKKLDALKAEVMRTATLAVVDGLPPLGALTATLAAVEEQVAAIYQGVMLAEVIAPTGDGHRLTEYHAVVEELWQTTRLHIAELHKLAKVGVKQGPVQAAREIEQLESMFADPNRTQKPS